MRRDGRKRGQSLLEYIVMIMVVVIAIIAALTKFIKPAVEQSMTDSGDMIKKASSKVQAGLGL